MSVIIVRCALVRQKRGSFADVDQYDDASVDVEPIVLAAASPPLRRPLRDLGGNDDWLFTFLEFLVRFGSVSGALIDPALGELRQLFVCGLLLVEVFLQKRRRVGVAHGLCPCDQVP